MGTVLGRLLRQIIPARGEQEKLQKATGIPKSTFSNVLNGNVTIPESWLLRLVDHFRDRPDVQSRIVAAYLTDYLPRELGGFVEIRTRTLAGGQVETFKPPLDEFEAALQDIARHPDVRAVRSAVFVAADIVALVEESRKRARK